MKVVMVCCGIVLLLAAGCGLREPDTKKTSNAAGMVGSDACKSCHEDFYKLWYGSYHRRAMLPATPEFVKGDFTDNNTIEVNGVRHEMTREGDTFYMTAADFDGKVQKYKLDYFIADRMLQWYTTTFPDGRIQILPIWWDVRKKEWYAGTGASPMLHGRRESDARWYHWTGNGQNWNYVCYDCHMTGMDKNFDPETNTYNSTWKELGVACESCHGPAERHIELAKAGELDKPRDDIGLIVLGHMNAEKTVDHCSVCHVAKAFQREGFRAGDSGYDYWIPLLLDSEEAYPDGTQRRELYQYIGFLQTQCYLKGEMSCMTCHKANFSVHPGAMRYPEDDDRQCTETCHASEQWTSQEHLRHKPDSEGARCVNCHMPRSAFERMTRREHYIAAPDPRITQETGAPNACTMCHYHAEKSPEWAIGWVDQWYGEYGQRRRTNAQTVHMGREGRPEAEPRLLELIADNSNNQIMRASAVNLLRQYNNQPPPQVLLDALADQSPMVRSCSAITLSLYPLDVNAIQSLRKALTDSNSFVRSNAAFALLQGSEWESAIPHNEKQAFQTALEEFRANLGVNRDDPAAQTNLGNVAWYMDDEEQALAYYHNALRIEEDYIPARYQTGMLHSENGRYAEAEQAFRTILQYNPDFFEAYYALGLLFGEQQNFARVAEELEQAVRLRPDHAGAQYNLGLAYDKLSKPGDAETALRNAIKADRTMLRAYYALGIVLYNQNQLREARDVLETAVKLNPGYQSAGELLRTIEARLLQTGE